MESNITEELLIYILDREGEMLDDKDECSQSNQGCLFVPKGMIVPWGTND